MTIRVANVPARAVDVLITELEKHGVKFAMVNAYRGAAMSEAGTALFSWEDEVLTVTVTRNEGHFSERMLRGGLKQLVGEAVEGLQ